MCQLHRYGWFYLFWQLWKLLSIHLNKLIQHGVSHEIKHYTSMSGTDGLRELQQGPKRPKKRAFSTQLLPLDSNPFAHDTGAQQASFILIHCFVAIQWKCISRVASRHPEALQLIAPADCLTWCHCVVLKPTRL